MTDSSPKYYREEPVLEEQVKALFKEYVGIQDDEEIVRHIKEIRQKAWQLFPYPCIGTFAFLELTIQDLAKFKEVLSRMKTGNETFLDLGCCFAQDIRNLVFEGAPSDRMTGFELRREFVDFGYELFRDRETLASEFVIGDFFDGDCGLREGSFDVIHASSFFHLFNWDEQVEAVSKAVRLLKPKQDSLIVGRQAGTEVADTYSHSTCRSGEMYRHNPESLERLVGEVARKTGTQLKVQSAFGGIKDENLRKEGFIMLNFSIRML